MDNLPSQPTTEPIIETKIAFTHVVVLGLLALTFVVSLLSSPLYTKNADASPKKKDKNNAAKVVATDVYEGYLGGKLFMHITDSTKEEAAGNCLLNATVNYGQSVLCTWGDEELYRLGANDKRDKCNKSVDVKKKQRKSGGNLLSDSILIGTCDTLSPVVTDVEFIDLLVSRVKIESEANSTYGSLYGWTNPMLLQAYPGLLQSDFASVETILVPPGTVAAITSDGFRNLARELSSRLGIPLGSASAVDAIMAKIKVAP